MNYVYFFCLLSCATLLGACATETQVLVEDPRVEDVIELVEANVVPSLHRRPKAVLVGERRLTTRADRAVIAEMQSSLPTLTPEVRQALLAQRDLLQRQRASKVYEIDGLELRKRDFIKVIDKLLTGSFMTDPLDGVSVSYGEPVKFTGYYSPEVTVSKKRTARFRYPILSYPKGYEGRLPSRRAIELEGVLNTKALALAWAEHPLDVYMLQLQGSGFVRFQDGSRRYLAYAGTNRYPYQSIELAVARRDSSFQDLSMRNLRSWINEQPRVRDSITCFNPNYGFFKLSDGAARGAAGLPLQPMISVAADPEFYPLGSVLLAKVPVPGTQSEFTTQLLLVQDTGGAVKGSRHLDLYTGVGESALDLAEVSASYGEVYLLSPR